MADVDNNENTKTVDDTKKDKVIKFSDLGLGTEVLKAVTSSGYETPTDIQAQAIPALLRGEDLLGQAQTGSGKTAAFALPAIQNLKFDKTVEVLVLTPTRELTQQVVDEFTRLGKFKDTKVVTVVGGQPAYRQIELVNRGAQVVVATPGRLLDHLRSKKFKRFSPSLVILDEADEMLDMGFIEDIKKIFSYTPDDRQTVMFSATMPKAIRKLAEEEMNNPKTIMAKNSGERHKDIEQILYIVNRKERLDALVRLISSEDPEKALVFCRTRRDTDDVCIAITKRGIRARAIHGDMNQSARDQAMREIKQGTTKILVATDVASRGIDISELSHVFNYHAPDNKERYTHRIGRTGRAGKKGKAISIATPEDIRQHYFYKQQPMDKFKVEVIPSRTELKDKYQDKLIEKVNNIEIAPEAKEFFSQLSSESNIEEFFCRMFTCLQKSESVKGPNKIGLSIEEIKSLASRPQFSGSGRSGGRGGRGRGASAGGRPRRGAGGGRSSGGERRSTSSGGGRSSGGERRSSGSGGGRNASGGRRPGGSSPKRSSGGSRPQSSH